MSRDSADLTFLFQSALLSRVELEANEAAFTAALIPFASHENQLFLIVGTAKETYMAPRACRQAYLHTYALGQEGRELTLLHKVRLANAQDL